jgi:hypothetical protein
MLAGMPSVVASDGTRALLLGDVQPNLAGSAVWDEAAGTVSGLNDGHGSGGIDGALAGGTAAWAVFDGGNSERSSVLFASVDGAPPVRVASSDAICDPCKGTALSAPRGQGNLLVYTSWQVDGSNVSAPQLWRIEGAQAVSLGALDAHYVDDVDADRILVTRLDGSLAVLDSSGIELSHLTVTPGEGSASALTGNQVVVLDGGHLAVYDASSGLQLASWPAAPDNPLLLGAASGVAAYIDGIAVHVVRLSDGRDITLRIPDAGARARGALNPSGLFVSFASELTYRGEAVFVTMDSLAALLDAPPSAAS